MFSDGFCIGVDIKFVNLVYIVCIRFVKIDLDAQNVQKKSNKHIRETMTLYKKTKALLHVKIQAQFPKPPLEEAEKMIL